MVTLEMIRADLEKKLRIEQTLRSVEVRADSIDEALTDAAVQLETSSRNLEYEVVERGFSGFLGMSKKPWLLRIYQNPNTVSLAKKDSADIHIDGQEEDGNSVPIDVDGKAFVRFIGGNILLKIVPPTGSGKPVSVSDILPQCSRSDTIQVDEDLVHSLVKSGTDDDYSVIGSFNHNAANDAGFVVNISSDEMTVTITAVRPATGGSEISVDRIERQLLAQGIAHGINKEKMQAFADEPVYGIPVVVAEGTKAQDGRDAYIAYNFETDTSKLRLKEAANGQVNFKELNLIQNVVEGQPLAQKMLPERGKGGKTVLGKYCEARNGKDIAIPIGKNVKLDSDGRTVLASTSGQVLLVANKITVEPIMQIDGDVGIKTGNITFLGTVIISGNVDDGFNVKASGNIEIYGNVGKCNIEADGDIIMSLGISGRDEGYVHAGKSLWAKFIQNAKVDVEDTIVVSDSIINSNVTANRRIVAQGKHGTIIGGHLFATEDINCKNIGSNGGGSETILEVGFNPKSKLRLDTLNAKQASIVQQLEEISLNISTLENNKKIRKQLSPEKEDNLRQLISDRETLMEDSNIITSEIQEIQTYLRDLKVIGKVSASGTVYPGVKIYIRDTKEEVRTELKKVTFYLENGFIRQGAYEQPAENDAKRSPDGYTTN